MRCHLKEVQPMLLCELAQSAAASGISLGELAVRLEAEETGVPPDEIRDRVRTMLHAMRHAVEEGIRAGGRSSRSGLSGGDAARLSAWLHSPRALPGGRLLARSLAYAVAVSEVNAAMGRIVAAPTAGSSGVIPGTFLALAEETGLGEESLVDALCTAGLVGQVIAARASLSGAEAGCQAECGAAAAMAAAGLAQLRGGTAEDCIHAAAIALKGLMGLVCDPVAGLVEVPCVKRNATSAAVAIAASEMALAGIRSRVPPDEVISAMGEVGRSLPPSLRETARGGLAATPSGQMIASRVRTPR